MEGIVKPRSINRFSQGYQEQSSVASTSTRSVLDALKEISRKRIHASEVIFDIFNYIIIFPNFSFYLSLIILYTFSQFYKHHIKFILLMEYCTTKVLKYEIQKKRPIPIVFQEQKEKNFKFWSHCFTERLLIMLEFPAIYEWMVLFLCGVRHSSYFLHWFNLSWNNK